ncbi:MAG: 2-dehydro-3-deoxygalactonokinase [Myxococcales bacterium]|nr:2-dehydro-3-deoxygalactonokinase [Myxococcales bacterium]
MSAALIGIDWGTSRVRALLLASDGAVLERRESDEGLLRVPPSGFPGVCAQLTRGWPTRPRLLAGMVGSAHGWCDAGYLDCPADAVALAGALVPVDAATWIVPGLRATSPAGQPDVMRGEETQLVGLDRRDGAVCLPGTHAKWASLAAGRVTGFATAMTGEVHALCREHSLLGRFMQGEPLPARAEAAFARGVAHGKRPGGLLHHLFAARSLTLTGALAPAEVAAWLSGLLIGHEVRALAPAGQITLVGAPALTERYAAALDQLGRKADCVDGVQAAAAGLTRIARAAGLFGERGR